MTNQPRVQSSPADRLDAPRTPTWRAAPEMLLLATFSCAIIAAAWLSDDAYITFRTIDNWLSGYGLRWNVVERVQSFTHPLWLLLLTPVVALTGEVYGASLACSVALSVVAAALISFSGAESRGMRLLALGGLLASQAFVDYSTSGLENPLTHCLLGLFLLVVLDRRARSLTPAALVASLIGLARLDALLLVTPALVMMFDRRRPLASLSQLALGMTPLLAWELFSLVYYGFLFPNTAYAKLGVTVPRLALVDQGLHYLYNSLVHDPALLLLIALSLGLLTLQPGPRRGPLALGIGLYLAYVVWIGGDFMSGRFLTAPFYCAMGLLARMDARRFRTSFAVPLLITVLLYGGAVSLSGLYRQHDPALGDPIDARGVADERAFYWRDTGLFAGVAPGSIPHRWADEGRALRQSGPAVVTRDSIGFAGYFAGPRVFIVDVLALADPLLARMPLADPGWRPGHFRRAPPAGYLESLPDGPNRITDTALAAYYDKLRLITRGPLFTLDRWRAILELNTAARLAPRPGA